MTFFEAIVLGILQGLTEFLPISSSGHIELGKVLLGVEEADNLTFSVIVHGATVLSTIIVFRKDIVNIIKELLKFRWNEEAQFVTNILISMIPVGIVGLMWEEEIESLFSGRVIFVGFMLLLTAAILFSTTFVKHHDKKVTPLRAIIIGIAQSIAILPGISRSGATIGTALLLNVDKEKATRFSFLMVLIPIAGATLIKLTYLINDPAPDETLNAGPILSGFVAAFISGLFACKWMIRIVKKGKIAWFSLYCLLAGLTAILSGWLIK